MGDQSAKQISWTYRVCVGLWDIIVEIIGYESYANPWERSTSTQSTGNIHWDLYGLMLIETMGLLDEIGWYRVVESYVSHMIWHFEEAFWSLWFTKQCAVSFLKRFTGCWWQAKPMAVLKWPQCIVRPQKITIVHAIFLGRCNKCQIGRVSATGTLKLWRYYIKTYCASLTSIILLAATILRWRWCR